MEHCDKLYYGVLTDKSEITVQSFLDNNNCLNRLEKDCG